MLVMPRTLVFVHAHPDDEALLTAGTMARAVREGNRVVLIVATDGGAGLASSRFDDLGSIRLDELHESAAILGVSRIETLGYPDSGLHGEISDGFAHAGARHHRHLRMERSGRGERARARAVTFPFE
jgi:LmbE family N-acetylglucosaminyl deacetylase